MSARKSPGERSNFEKPVYRDLNITWDGEIRGPELPSGRSWCDQTREWWSMIRHSAQAMSFHDTDWAVMLDTALLHQTLWGTTTVVGKDGEPAEAECRPSERSSLASEIRRRCESYGFTWADRRKYGINIVTTDDVTQEAEQVARSAVNYRDKLKESTGA